MTSPSVPTGFSGEPVQQRNVGGDPTWCVPDDCPVAICGGPHYDHRCTNGDTITGRAGSACPFCGDTIGREQGNVGGFTCRCVWAGQRCPNQATQEDQLCDWCGTRRPEDLRNSRKALFGPDGEFLGLGGGGEAHVDPTLTPDACWMPGSGRVLATEGT